MFEIWKEPWFPWAVGLAIGLPVVLVVLTEVYGALVRRGSAAAKPVRLLRNLVVPVLALFLLMTLASDQQFDVTWVRVVGTVLGFLLILLLLSAFNVALFTNATEGSWQKRLPSIFIDLARLALILVGLAILFSWVWGADVGGLVAALGVTSIVIGLALQNAVGSVISGLLLLFEQPFKLGDFLDTPAGRGRVVEVNWRAVHIDTGNGIQIMPNATLAGASFTNLSQPAGAYVATVAVKFTTDDAPHEVSAMLATVAAGLPMLDPAGKPGVSYSGNAGYTVSLPVVSPAVEGEATALFLGWLWYAARRHDLALDGDATDPVNTPDRVREALALVGPSFSLGEDYLDTIAATCRLEQWGAGETLQVPGVVPDALRIVIEGRLLLSTPFERSRLQFGELEPGESIGLTSLTRQPTSYFAVAAGPVLTLRVPRSAVDAAVRINPPLARRIGEQLDNRQQISDDAVAAARSAAGVVVIGDGTASLD
ncbi:mechanosensitive ion channel domain-containing protein [Herbiconiux sp. YIM B11900]|uniref:mechanosensitive ion channel domain-containing protein n=1 Tax=Herbiconiux sp. YIM B11900 TaxID=3404131 RepID=UPI003F87321C